ncbi:helix-turn-helix domain-containing protein [Halalkalibacter oceani]|uniref:helix-turn-helix domain-containing protein n=1 Tax=Halalkalibacter oceani TaxID=1653776 RepID=UPI003394A859
MIRKKRKKCLLRYRLAEKRMSHTELAQITGISVTQISEYISNKRGMSLDNAATIAYVLNTQIDDLYDWDITISE